MSELYFACTTSAVHPGKNIPGSAAYALAILPARVPESSRPRKAGILDTASHRMGRRNLKPADNGALPPTLFSGPSGLPKQAANRAF